ncbi:MAG: hypothetical protein ACM3U2_20170 [Deltaproteobacteria bacterium]
MVDQSASRNPFWRPGMPISKGRSVSDRRLRQAPWAIAAPPNQPSEKHVGSFEHRLIQLWDGAVQIDV